MAKLSQGCTYFCIDTHTHTPQAHKITNKVFIILNIKPVNSKEAWSHCSNQTPSAPFYFRKAWDENTGQRYIGQKCTKAHQH